MADKSHPRKVLRIGIIQDGKIVQERLLKAGESVTVGENPKSTFVFPKTHLPGADFVLFQWTGKEYLLRFTEHMKGKIDRIGAANAVMALNNLREDPGIRRVDGIFTYPIGESDRGKISVDNVTVLFQFVAPPAASAVSPIQTTDFRPRLLADDDPVFLGFLAVWGSMAMLLGLWVAFTEPPELTLDNAGAIARIVVPPRVEEEAPPVDEEKPAEEAPTKTAEAAPAPKGPDKSAEEQKDDLMKEDKLLAALIGTTGEANSGVVVTDVLGENQGLGDVDAALKGALGATTDAAGAGYKAGQGGKGDVATIDGIGGLGGGNGGAGGNGAAAAALKVAVSTGDGEMGELTGDKATVTKTVRGYSGQVKYCYESRLKVVPSLGGRVEIGWTIETGGAVSGVYTVSNDTGDAELAKCIEGKVRRWRFPAETTGDVTWPFVLTAKGG